MRSDSAWIKHDTDALADGVCWQIFAELCANVAVVSMGGDNATPHDTVLAHGASWSLLVGQSLVDVCDALAHVEVGILAVLNALDLQPRLAAMLVASVALVAKVHGLAMQSHWLRHLGGGVRPQLALHCRRCARWLKKAVWVARQDGGPMPQRRRCRSKGEAGGLLPAFRATWL